VIAPVIIAGLVICADVWVLLDARRWTRKGTPVVFRFGSITIATPETWAALCLLLFVIFLPIYAIARRA
jgi:hypothetical protein